MKDILSQMAAYNVWANQKLLEVIIALPEEKQKQQVSSSFSSLYTTLLHMYSAESIWWQRIIAGEGEYSYGHLQRINEGIIRRIIITKSSMATVGQ